MHGDIERLSRTTGLDEDATGSGDVNRRRTQLWVLSLVVGACIPAIVLLLGVEVSGQLGEVLDVRALRLALVALLVAVLGYVWERERALRRLDGLLGEEQSRSEALRARVNELDRLLDAAHAANSTLSRDVVLDVILDSACELLDAGDGVVLVGTDRHRLAAAAVRGDPNVEDAPVAEAVEAGRPVVRDGWLATPLLRRDVMVGVCCLRAVPDRRPFDTLDVRTVAVFAETAAGALADVVRRDSERLEDLIDDSRARKVVPAAE